MVLLCMEPYPKTINIYVTKHIRVYSPFPSCMSFLKDETNMIHNKFYSNLQYICSVGMAT